MKRLPGFLLLLAALPLAAAQIETKQVLSKTYTIDRKYRSMEGPASSDRIYLGDPTKPELIWIIGVKTEMVGEDGKTPQLPELMCHVNVDLDANKHQTLFKFKRPSATRLITLSQGMLGAELPRGYGFPIASNEPLILFTQVLNHNIEKPNNIKVRHRITFEYVRDKDLAVPLKPLFNVGASGMVLLNDLNASIQPVDAGGAHGASCLLAPRAPNANGLGADYVDPAGRKLTGHWVVPPGHQENHSDITWFMNLQYDTVMHFAAVHLHPFAKSLTLRDVTTGQTIFIAKADNPRKGVGLDRVDTIVSERGMPIYKDHKYELVSVYDNPTKQNADSMASIFMGLEDPEFVRPTSAQLAARATDHLITSNTSVVVLRTTAGDIAITPLRTEAPQTSRAFLHLVREGAYEGARVTKIDKHGVEIASVALTPETKAEVAGITPETTARHEPGMLSMCRGSAGITMIISTDPSRDGKCTAFARVGAGAAVLRAMSGAAVDANGKPTTPITITKAELYETASEAVSKLRVAAK
jgi:cyclophilin family peptidyl-prolyl cis-trans isomerase